MIHIEHQWNDNYLTVAGDLMHDRVHTEGQIEKRNNVISMHDLSVYSPTLGVIGKCDNIEFIRDDSGITLNNYEGSWMPNLVEYKHGSSKNIDCDRAQLCCQAMCLEEMLCIELKQGSLYYGNNRRRETVLFDDELRQLVTKSLQEMHALFNSGFTPKVKPNKACTSCSLKDICLPSLIQTLSIEEYLNKAVKEL